MVMPKIIVLGAGLALILLVVEMIKTYKTERFMFYIRGIFAILSIGIMVSMYFI